MILQTVCKGNIDDEGFTVTNGESGTGIYFFIPSKAMREHYAQDERSLITVEVKSTAQILDLTAPALKSELIAFIKNHHQKRVEKGDGYMMPVITTKTYQRFGTLISDFISQHHPNADGWMVLNADPTAPTGRQVVICNPTCFRVVISRT